MAHVVMIFGAGFLAGAFAMGAFVEWQNLDIGGYWLFLHKDTEHKK